MALDDAGDDVGQVSARLDADELAGHRHKAALLRVLERPEIPIHTNGSENDIRACVTKRKISGGTMSEAGRTARDVMLGLMKTCAKLEISFFRYLDDRLGIPGGDAIPPLADLVRKAATV